MNLESLKEILLTGETEVTFTKKDGTERVMRCTMNFDIIPNEFLPKKQVETNSTKKETPKKPELFKVFDLENNGWRSFNFNQVTNFLQIV